VGCGDYQSGWPRLPNPVKDAREVATTLKNMGWKVDLLENPEGSLFLRKLNQLIVGPGRDKDKGILLWFSGHGYTLKEADGLSLGYLVPIDAPDPEKDEIGFMEKAVSMRYIETVAKRIQAKHVLMAFDSCFSGAIFQMVRAKPSAYIQEKVGEPVRQFITAGNEAEQVPDRSVFKDVFIQGIHKGYADRNNDGYVTGEELGSYLQENVINYSKKTQHPQYGKINNPMLDKGDFIFQLASSGETSEGQITTTSKAHLYVDTHPKDAKIRILNIGPAFHQGIELDEGSYHVEVSAEGYETQKMWVSLTAGHEKTLDVRLDKNVGFVRTSPDNTQRGWIGVAIADINEEVAKNYGIKEQKGVLIAEVAKKGPADLAGMKSKDVILSVNDKAVDSARQLAGIIKDTNIGDTIAIKINRNGQIRTIIVKIAKREQAKIPDRSPQTNQQNRLGIQVAEITPETVRQYSLDPKYAKGVMVVGMGPDSKAEEAGLQNYDVIKDVNLKNITSVSDLNSTINEIPEGETIKLLIYRRKIGFLVILITQIS